jgi:hypothetical protein
MKEINFFLSLLLFFILVSCNERKEKINNNFLNKNYDSLRYFKDVDWVTFNGIGIGNTKPYSNYPYTEFGYKGKTIDILVHFSETIRYKVQLNNFLNGLKYYYKKQYGDGKYITFYYVFDISKSKKICFWGDGKIDNNLKADIREVKYITKEGNNYKTEIFNGKFNSVIIPWQKIISKDSILLKKNFCNYMNYIEEYNPPNLSTVYEQVTTLCNSTNTNKIDSSRKIIAVDPENSPSIFYFKVLGGNGFTKSE